MTPKKRKRVFVNDPPTTDQILADVNLAINQMNEEPEVIKPRKPANNSRKHVNDKGKPCT